MSFQDPWVVGHRLYLTRDVGRGLPKKTVDLGVIQGVTPGITSESISLSDPDGGVNRTIATANSSVEETYQVQTANCSLDNLAIALLGSEVEDINLPAVDVVVTHEASPGALVSLLRSSNGERTYDIDGISHVARRKRIQNLTLTGIDVSERQLTFQQAHGLDIGDIVVITKYLVSKDGTALSDETHEGEYEVESVTDTTNVVITAATAQTLGNADETDVAVYAFQTEAMAVTNLTVTAINVTDRIFTFDAAHGLSAGDLVIVTNATDQSGGPEMVNPKNVGTYEVLSAPSTTTIEVSVDSAAQLSNTSESGIAVDALVYTAGMEVFRFGKDYEEYSLGRGLVRLVPKEEGGGINVPGDLEIGIQIPSLTGRREFKPQIGTNVEGQIEIFFSRDGFSKETVRYTPKASLVLNAADFQVDDFSSITFDVTILSDGTEDGFGYMRQTKGDPQSVS